MDDPLRKYHHSMQDEILHPAQSTREPAQFHERISTSLTVKTPKKSWFFDLKPLFLFDDLGKGTITRCRIKFCIQQKQLENQHSFTSEYQPALLWKLHRNPGFSPENPSFCSMTPFKSTITRCRIKFCIRHNQIESQHSFTSEYQQGLLWKLPRNPVFSPENPSFCSMTPFKSTITRCRIKFCIRHNQIESQHSFTSEYQQGLLWKHPRNPGFSRESPSFCSMTSVKNTITRCRIKFCIQHNELESQHSFISEYQQEILESAANFSYMKLSSIRKSVPELWILSHLSERFSKSRLV